MKKHLIALFMAAILILPTVSSASNVSTIPAPSTSFTNQIINFAQSYNLENIVSFFTTFNTASSEVKKSFNQSVQNAKTKANAYCQECVQKAENFRSSRQRIFRY